MIYTRWLSGHDDLAEPLRIRRTVFIDEQGFAPETEPDAHDTQAIHLLVGEGEGFVGTARLFQYDGGTFKIGRIAVLKPMRGRGLGDLMMRMLIQKALDLGAQKIALGSQLPVVPFYKKYGFQEAGDTYSEDGVLHQGMELLAENARLPHACTQCGQCGKPAT